MTKTTEENLSKSKYAEQV